MGTTSTKPTRSRTSRTAAQWQALFDHFDQSDQSREQFCHEQGISISSFSRWRTKLREQTSGKPMPSNSLLFTELALEGQPTVATVWDIELQLGTDVFLRLRRPC